MADNPRVSFGVGGGYCFARWEYVAGGGVPFHQVTKVQGTENLKIAIPAIRRLIMEEIYMREAA